MTYGSSGNACVDSTVNNPAECVGHWKAGRVRPLAVIDQTRIDLADWREIPTMQEAMGHDMSYLMLRGIFMASGAPKEAQAWYVNLFQKVTETPEWKKYVTDNALQPAFMSGSDYVKWLEEKDAATRQLMQVGGLIK